MKHQDFSAITAEQVAGAQSDVGLSHYRNWGKRVLDLTIALVALPIVLLTCLVVRLFMLGTDQKLIFSQPRVGKDGRVFNCYKFQTMVNDAETVLADMCANDPVIKAEWDTYQKLENDPRITKIGKLLRKTSLDELPQVFNVLCGNMSIVGPRPFLESQKDQYIAGGGTHYFAMKPGITGNWQVEGRGSSEFLSRVAYDHAYYDSMSLSEDFRLLTKTVVVLLRMTGH